MHIEANQNRSVVWSITVLTKGLTLQNLRLGTIAFVCSLHWSLFINPCVGESRVACYYAITLFQHVDHMGFYQIDKVHV